MGQFIFKVTTKFTNLPYFFKKNRSLKLRQGIFDLIVVFYVKHKTSETGYKEPKPG